MNRNYSIRYMIKKEGDQLVIWDKNVSEACLHAQLIADAFVNGVTSGVLADTGWVCEEPNFWRRKIVFDANSDSANFSLHISVGLERDSDKSSF